MLMQQIRNFFFWLFSRKMNSRGRKISPVALHQAKTIGIIFNAINFHNNKQIMEFAKKLRAERRQVELLAYLPKREFGDTLPFDYFTNKKVNWLGRAGSDIIERFSNTKFDLLINFQTAPKLPLEYIAVKNPSTYKVTCCPDGDIANYDLILISKENNDISNVINNLEKYLR